MRELPPLNSLRTFEAAARRMSFTAAADELCVTHSAVSHQMRQLEEWMECKLFRRQSGGVLLTEAGQALQQVTSQALALLEARCAEIRTSQQRAEIVLGAPGSFLANWLIPRLPKFEAAHPQVRLRLQTSSAEDELQKQRVDALILVGRKPWPQQMVCTPLFEERIGPVCTPSLARKIKSVKDLPHQKLLHTTSHPAAWTEWARAQHVAEGAFSPGRRLDHLTLLVEAAAHGMGVAIAPSLLVEREMAQKRLVAPLGFVTSGSFFALCVQAQRAPEAKLVVLRKWLRAEAMLPETS
jgi:DNA-binding transcriptional LysR family regulator